MKIQESIRRIQEIRDGTREEEPLSKWGVECFRAIRDDDLLYDIIEKIRYDEVV